MANFMPFYGKHQEFLSNVLNSLSIKELRHFSVLQIGDNRFI